MNKNSESEETLLKKALTLHQQGQVVQAKALYELRRIKGKLKDINELKELSEFTPEVIQRLKPYLNFE